MSYQKIIFIFGLLCIAPPLTAELASTPVAPPVAAKSYILQDFHSGHVITELNADAQLEPASMTKIMTAYVVFRAIRNGDLALHDQVKISKKAWSNPGIAGWMNKGSRMFVDVGSSVSVEDLLRGLIVQSGNDAAIALAEHLYGSEEQFVLQMNLVAAELGMTNTKFQNSTGWPAKDHYSSARDIATLSQELIRDHPELYKIFSEKRFSYNNIMQNNYNTLLWKDDSVDGIKTGTTHSAGYCLAASAQRGGMRLITVVMGASGSNARIKYSQRLLNHGFRNYETHQLFTSNAVLKDIRVWKGDVESLRLGLEDSLYITIPKGQYDKLKSVMQVRKAVFAPVTLGERMGILNLYLDEQLIEERQLVALDAIRRGNIIQRMADHITFYLQ